MNLKFLLPLLGGAALLLGGCNKEEVNARHQNGVWTIERVTATYKSHTGADSAVAVTDAGDVAFLNLDAITDRATFYLDKAIPSKPLSQGTGWAAPGTYVLGYQADRYDRHRVQLLSATGAFGSDVGVTFNLKEDGADAQTWELLGVDNQDQITYREEWQLKRQ